MLTNLTQYLFYGLVAYALVILFARWSWIADVFITYVPQFVIAAIVVAVALLMQRKILRALVLAATILYFGFPLFSLWMPSPAPSNESGAREIITIMNANVNKDNRQYQKLIDLIESNNPTVITLNEVTAEWLTSIKQAVGERYPFTVERPYEGYQGMAILSQLPVNAQETLLFSDRTPPLLHVSFADRQVTLFALHALPPVSKSLARERDAFITFLADEVQSTFGSVIVAGDFNATARGVSFRSFLEETKLRDSRQGYGWQPSWFRGTILAAAIDHILYRGDLSLSDFKVLADIGSDHRPLLTTFTVK